MNFVDELREVFGLAKREEHGPLGPLLVMMTVSTGLVDAFSYLTLGHVFVANMTGNILFLGFALAGARDLSISASLVALVSFVVGAGIAGLIHSKVRHHRARVLSISGSVQVVFVAIAVLCSAIAVVPMDDRARYTLIVVMAVSMGIQNATSRRLAVPDLTTTVLTLTIVGLGADNRLVGGPGAKAGRRLVAIACMLLGALVGAVLVLHVRPVWALVVVLVLVSVATLTSGVLGRGDPAWAVRG